MQLLIVISSAWLALCMVACAPPPQKGRDELVQAIASRSLSTVQQLTQSGCDISSPDNRGNHLTPLMWAIKSEDRQIFEYLLDRGADPNKTNIEGETTLHFAIYGRDRNADLVNLLIKHGANVNAKDKRGSSVLDYANAKPEAPKLINLLLQAGAK